MPGPLAPRFIHETREGIVNSGKPMLEMTLIKQTPKTRTRRKKPVEDGEEDASDTPLSKKRKTAAAGKGKGKKKVGADEIDVDEELDHMYVDTPLPRKNQPLRSTQKKKVNRRKGDDEESECETIEADMIENTSDEDSDDVTYDWSRSLREEPAARRKTKSKAGNGALRLPPDEDILVVSD